MAPVAARPKLTDFFLRLAEEPALLADHARDPRAAMAGSGMTSEQIATVLNGGAERVREAVEVEVAADPRRRHVVVTPRMTTHTPKPPPPDGEPEPDEPQPPSDRNRT